MAIIKTADGDVKLFTAADPYRYDVDNRPLRELINNDVLLNTELTANTTEITNARTDNTGAAPVVFSTLDARLEAMGLSSLGNSSVSYSIFQSNAEKTRARYQSGWIAPPTGQQFQNIYNNNFVGDDWGGLFGSVWFTTQANTLFINNEYASTYFPVHTFINGWHIKMLNINANGASAYGSHTTVKLPTAPASGGRQDFTFLEVWLKEIPDSNRRFWLYGSPQYNVATLGVSEGTFVLDTNGSNGNYVADPLDPRVVHSLARLSNGNWLQVQYRIRVFSGINPIANSDGFTGTTGTTPLGNAEQVFGQGSQNTPVSSRPYTAMATTLADAGLYRAGNGAADTTLLGTIDGYTYAVPIAMIHRRNSGDFTMTNQNGSKKVGDATSGSVTSTVKSGRPDGRSYDGIDRDDFLDMRNWIEPAGFEYERLMTRSFDEILTGLSRSQWESLDYSGTAQPIYGNRLLTNDTIFSNATFGANPNYAVTVTNTVKDNSKAGTPQAVPDGARQLWPTSQTAQRFEFWVDPWATTTSHAFITFQAIGGSRKKIQLALDTLSGGGGTGGTQIRVTNADGTPYTTVWRWQTDNSEISLVQTGSVTQPNFDWDTTGRSGADGRVYGNIDILFPTKSGTLKLPTGVSKQEFFDGATTFTSSVNSALTAYPLGCGKDTSNRLWVASHYSGVNAFTEAADGSLTPVTGVTQLQNANISGNFPDGSPGTFQYLVGLAVWGNPYAGAGSGAVYVCDYYARAIKKYTYNTGTNLWIPAAWMKDCGNAIGGFSFGNVPYGTVGPWGLVISSDGATLYASDYARQVVFKITTSTFTGNGVASSSATILAGVLDTPGETIVTGAIKLSGPRHMWLESDGLWVTDSGNSRVIKIDTSTPSSIQVNFKPTSNNLPSNLISPTVSIPLGADSSNPTGYIIASGQQGKCRVYRLDSLLQVTATSSTPYANTNAFGPGGGGITGAEAGAWNLVRSISVDNLTTPTRIYVAKDGIYRNNANEVGIEILDATTLATISRSSDSVNGVIGGVFSLSYIDGKVWVVCNNSGIPSTAAYPASFTAQLTITSDVVAVNANFATTTTGDSYGFLSNMVTFNYGGTIGSRKSFIQTITQSTAGAGTRCVRWSSADAGVTWTRDTAVIAVTASTLPYGVAVDNNAAVYVAYILDNLVKRYDFTANGGVGTYALTASFGTGVGTTGGAKNQVTYPVSVILAADAAKVVVTCHKSKTSEDAARLVTLTTTLGNWTGGTQFLSDTNNTSTLVIANMIHPCGVVANGGDLYVADGVRNVIYRMTKTSGSDPKSFIRQGYFGIPNEQGNDHAHVNGPFGGMVMMSSYVTLVDSYNNRILKFHPKMAGVSNASGNIATMSPVLATESLRIWYATSAYQGVGKSLFPDQAFEEIFNNQVLAQSDSLYCTTLGRSPLPDSSYSVYKGAIDKLPLGNKQGAFGFAAATVDSTSFNGDSLQVQGFEGMGSGAFFKLPIINYGQTSIIQFGGSGEDSAIALISRVTYHMGFVSKGFATIYTGIYRAPAFKTSVNHVTALPFLIKRSGKVYLCVITNVWLDTSNDISRTDGIWTNAACDLYEVPGRLLAR